MSVEKGNAEEILGGKIVVSAATPNIVNGFRRLKIQRAREFALAAHGGQLYGNEPFAVHLTEVVRILEDFGFTGDYLAAGWLHDAVEDTEQSIEDVCTHFGEQVAELVWAVTGGGERASHVNTIHEKISDYPDAAVVKLADRIANVEASTLGDKHSARYIREHKDFAPVIRPHVPVDMWKRYLQALNQRRKE